MTVLEPFWVGKISNARFLIKHTLFVITGSCVPYYVFCFSCFVRDSWSQIRKLDPKSLKFVFLGYSCIHKGYRCFSHTLNQYIVSRDVIYLENVHFFPVTTSHEWISLIIMTHELLAYPRRRSLITERMNCLDHNEIWNLAELLVNEKQIGCKWVFIV